MEYICSHCPLRFSQSEHLLSHFMSTHMPVPNQEPVPRPRKKRSNPCSQPLIQTLLIPADSDVSKEAFNSGDDENCCADCGKRFSTRGNLDRHTELHRGVNYPCVLCGKIYSQKYAWSQHMKAAHQGWKERKREEKVWKGFERCPYCADVFPSKEHMEQHMKTVHLGESKVIISPHHALF